VCGRTLTPPHPGLLTEIPEEGRFLQGRFIKKIVKRVLEIGEIMQRCLDRNIGTVIIYFD
jgi:hypothetical protein